MQWLADNATNGYFLFAFAAFMLAGVWWIQKQLIYVLGAGVALIGLLIFWLVIHNVPTTAGRIESDLNALAAALLAKDQAKAEQYVADDFKYRAKDRAKWFPYLEKMIADDAVDAIDVKNFRLKSRTGSSADVDFVLEVKHKGKTLLANDCPWKMIRAGDRWQVAKVSLRKIGGTKKADEDE